MDVRKVGLERTDRGHVRSDSIPDWKELIEGTFDRTLFRTGKN